MLCVLEYSRKSGCYHLLSHPDDREGGSLLADLNTPPFLWERVGLIDPNITPDDFEVVAHRRGMASLHISKSIVFDQTRWTKVRGALKSALECPPLECAPKDYPLLPVGNYKRDTLVDFGAANVLELTNASRYGLQHDCVQMHVRHLSARMLGQELHRCQCYFWSRSDLADIYFQRLPPRELAQVGAKLKAALKLLWRVHPGYC